MTSSEKTYFIDYEMNLCDEVFYGFGFSEDETLTEIFFSFDPLDNKNFLSLLLDLKKTELSFIKGFTYVDIYALCSDSLEDSLGNYSFDARIFSESIIFPASSDPYVYLKFRYDIFVNSGMSPDVFMSFYRGSK